MNDNIHHEKLNATELGSWENEGGALARDDDMSHYYGRRVEPNKSWTIYHVFSGAPAELEGWSMAGLGETEATSTMIFLNARNARRRRTSSLRQVFATRF